jgi:hypothetical protein
MNRRTFLKGLFGVGGTLIAAGVTGDWSPLEQWVPGRRKFFDLHIPPPKYGTIGLHFHSDAFALVMQPVGVERIAPAVIHLPPEWRG